jgi:hypothetical protein
MSGSRNDFAQSGQGVCRWSIDMIISVAIKTAGPQLTLSSCMAPPCTALH